MRNRAERRNENVDCLRRANGFVVRVLKSRRAVDAMWQRCHPLANGLVSCSSALSTAVALAAESATEAMRT